jgi:hypothetical protein
MWRSLLVSVQIVLDAMPGPSRNLSGTDIVDCLANCSSDRHLLLTDSGTDIEMWNAAVGADTVSDSDDDDDVCDDDEAFNLCALKNPKIFRQMCIKMFWNMHL